VFSTKQTLFDVDAGLQSEILASCFCCLFSDIPPQANFQHKCKNFGAMFTLPANQQKVIVELFVPIFALLSTPINKNSPTF
jgi:hypothetical protein